MHVKTNQPIKNVIRKLEMLAGMAKWSVKLDTFNIKYEPRSTMKSQTLADFMANSSNDL